MATTHKATINTTLTTPYRREWLPSDLRWSYSFVMLEALKNSVPQTAD